MYRVFLGAPPPPTPLPTGFSPSDQDQLGNLDSESHSWQTVSSNSTQKSASGSLEKLGVPLSASNPRTLSAQRDASRSFATRRLGSGVLSQFDRINPGHSFIGHASALNASSSLWIVPPPPYTQDTLDAASRRIEESLIGMGFYKNAIFDRTGGGDETGRGDEEEEEVGGYGYGSDEESDEEGDKSFEREEEGEGGRTKGDQTTWISWPPTNPDNSDSAILAKPSQPGSSSSAIGGRGLVRTDTTSISALNRTGSTSFFDSGMLETQTQSFDYSDGASSIGRFPTFHFDIHALASLSSHPHGSRSQLGNPVPIPATGSIHTHKSKKVNLLLAILEVDGPETIMIRKGPDAGKQVALLKMILGDEKGGVAKLSAWREVAEVWSGVGDGGGSGGCKRGDVIHLENVLLDTLSSTATTPTLTASPNLKSTLTICYRTMPYNVDEDHIFRPDLRLGESDPCVRKVAAVVRWFEGMAGLSGDVPKYGPLAS